MSNCLWLVRQHMLLLLVLFVLVPILSIAVPGDIQMSSGQSSNVFFENRGNMTVNWPLPMQLRSATIRVSDEMQHILQVLDVPAGTPSTQVDLPSRGFYIVEARASYDNGTTLTNKTTAAVLSAPLADDVRMHSRFGLANVNGAPSLAKKLGSNWDWFLIGPKTPADMTLAADGSLNPPPPAFYHVPGITRIFALGGQLPSWVQPVNANKYKLYAPTDWTLCDKIFTAYAQLPNFPKIFAVWNEPENTWIGTDADFVRFHSVAARAIKAVHPETKVLGPASGTIDLPRLKTLVNLGLLNDLDGLVVHAYVNGMSPEQDFIQRVIDLKAYLTSIGKKDFPVYYTEFGWTSESGTWQAPVDELTQARYVARSLALLSTTKFDGLCYFTLLYRTKNNGEAGFSLLYQDGTPKPSLVAFATLTNWLTTVNGEGCWLKLTPTTNMTLYRRERNTVGMLWTTDGQSAFRLPVTPSKLQDTMGRDLPILPNTALTLTPSPIYFELADNQALANITTLASVTVPPGGTLQVPWLHTVLPTTLLKQNGRKLQIASTTPLGTYVILGKTVTGWQALPIIVNNGLSVESAEMKANAQRSIQYCLTVHSDMAAPVTIRATMALTQGPWLASTPVVIPAHGNVVLSIPLASLGINRVYQGTVTIAATAAKISTSQPVSFTILAGNAVTTATPAWSQIPAIDVSTYAPYMNTPQLCKAFAPSDCSATMKTAYNDTGLSLQICVRDNQHVQTQSPTLMWRDDSFNSGLIATPTSPGGSTTSPLA